MSTIHVEKMDNDGIKLLVDDVEFIVLYFCIGTLTIIETTQGIIHIDKNELIAGETIYNFDDGVLEQVKVDLVNLSPFDGV